MIATIDGFASQNACRSQSCVRQLRWRCEDSRLPRRQALAGTLIADTYAEATEVVRQGADLSTSGITRGIESSCEAGLRAVGSLISCCFFGLFGTPE